MRYFCCLAGDEIYEQVRLELDAAWGHPNDNTKTETCIDPASVAPRDAQRRILLATSDQFCKYQASSMMLLQLLASGAVEEIDADTYLSAVSNP